MRELTVSLTAVGGYERGIESNLGSAEAFEAGIALYNELAALWPGREVLLST